MRDGTADRASRSRVRRWIAIGAAVLLAIVGAVVAVEAVRVAGDAEERPGLARFYEQPDDAANGAPGTLVRSEELAGTPAESRAWRIMYRSTDLNGAPIVVTGIVVVPLGPAPASGRTVLAWGHPTTGTDPSCAPSRAFDPFIGIEGLRMMLDRGYTVVATDYAGMGTTGPNSYLVGETAAHTVIDAVRAAQRIPDAQAGDRVVLWGHSQGGQAVLFAAENAPDYAPELDIVAVAAAAPAADLTALMGSHLDDISGVTIGSYAFPAFASVYGPSTPGAELGGILTSAAVAQVPEMNRLCLLTHLDQLHTIGQPLVGDFFLHDPTTTEPWTTLLAANSAGRTRFEAPLFIAQGADDELVLPADTEDFIAHERQLGVDVSYTSVPLATHATIAYLALPALEAWLDAHAR
ncbi:alpha/beta fold hydrolase [Compostimonas suwonensis]|uniref:Secretory lipase n=1 Tax=Compostimonas suwonensis TaxID=1048394 RepID=A0A2M9BZL1_9MICO|nr:alpha/beta fold hydrolase [Compostimonas suwonensis]PJJ63519.1 secretory lipase [Compostimonas suwonensis]